MPLEVANRALKSRTSRKLGWGLDPSCFKFYALIAIYEGPGTCRAPRQHLSAFLEHLCPPIYLFFMIGDPGAPAAACPSNHRPSSTTVYHLCPRESVLHPIEMMVTVCTVHSCITQRCCDSLNVGHVLDPIGGLAGVWVFGINSLGFCLRGFERSGSRTTISLRLQHAAGRHTTN